MSIETFRKSYNYAIIIIHNNPSVIIANGFRIIKSQQKTRNINDEALIQSAKIQATNTTTSTTSTTTANILIHI